MSDTEKTGEEENRVDIVAVPSLRADGTPDQTPGYKLLAGASIPDRVTPDAGVVPGEEVVNPTDSVEVGSRGVEADTKPKPEQKAVPEK